MELVKVFSNPVRMQVMQYLQTHGAATLVKGKRKMRGAWKGCLQSMVPFYILRYNSGEKNGGGGDLK